jgi:hypothetical protein
MLMARSAAEAVGQIDIDRIVEIVEENLDEGEDEEGGWW